MLLHDKPCNDGPSPFAMRRSGVRPPSAPPITNSFRYSSQYVDVETGLVYQGYRYYAPQFGRWINRDPIGERGGRNLYAMLANDSVGNVDALGLARED